MCSVSCLTHRDQNPMELAQFDLAGFERQLAGLRSGDLTTMKELGYVDPDSEG